MCTYKRYYVVINIITIYIEAIMDRSPRGVLQQLSE